MEDGNLKRIAKCCCGHASIEVIGEPEIHGVCHCNNCKQRTGSAFGISAYFKTENVLAKHGEFSYYSFQGSQTNSFQERYFCIVCGTTLFWRLSTSPNLVGIAGGCFAENPLGEPTYTNSCKKKFSWVKLPWRWKKYS
jgi:hypothetical protein